MNYYINIATNKTHYNLYKVIDNTGSKLVVEEIVVYDDSVQFIKHKYVGSEFFNRNIFNETPAQVYEDTKQLVLRMLETMSGKFLKNAK